MHPHVECLQGQPEQLPSTKYDGAEMTHVHPSAMGFFNPTPAPSHSEGLKRTELRLLPWIGAKREIAFSWAQGRAFLQSWAVPQQVYQVVEAIPLLCRTLAGKFAWLGFVVMTSRM